MKHLCSWNIPLDFYPPHLCVGPDHSRSLTLLSVSMRLLLYIHSYMTSVQLEFRQFWTMVVLQFSCNFEVMMGGSEYRVDLHCNLGQKPRKYFIFFSFLLFNFLLLFKNSYLPFPPTPPHQPSSPYLFPLFPPLVIVHVSFIIVPVNPSPFSSIIPSPLPSGHCQTVLNFNVSGYILLAHPFCWLL